MTPVAGCHFFFALSLPSVKKKKHKQQAEEEPGKPVNFDPELLRMYMMGATNPGFSNKIESNCDVIDLHLENVTGGKGHVAPYDALFVQLDKFEEALDRAIASGKFEFRVVHGLGKGKLKEAIYKLLDKNPQVRSYENTHHSKYGYGSTIIYLK